MTVIYLSTNLLQVVDGESGTQTVIHSCVNDTRISAFVRNGCVTDTEGFCRVVEEVFSENRFSRRNVTLVLNTTQVIARLMRVPAQSEEITLSYIANEFSDVERAKNPVYSYSILSTDTNAKFHRVLAMQTDEAYLRSFLSLFDECGIQVKSVQYHIACAVRALAQTKAAGKACIVQVMEQAGFDGILFAGGAYVYSTFTRLTGEHGTPEFGSEIARAVSVTVQVTKAQQLTQPVTDVFFAGFSEADILCAGEAIGRMGAMLNTEALGESSRITVKCANLGLRDCLYAAGGLQLADSSADFLCHMPEARIRKKANAVVKLVIALIVLAGILTAVTVGLGAMRAVKRNELKALTAQNTSDKRTEQLAYSDRLKQENTELCARLEALTRLSETVASYPLPNTAVIDELLACARSYAETEVVSYSSETGELVFSATAAEVDDIHKFVGRIAEHAMFEVLDYSGYLYVEATDRWSVAVTVRLAANAGRER